MAKVFYRAKNFRAEALQVIDHANRIINDYAALGFDLTLRQLYYQFVQANLLENTERSYKRLGLIVNDGRLAGLIDWDRITDRTRNLRSNSHWSSPAEIIRAAANSFALDKWSNQSRRPEVWIEKDALIGVIENVCVEMDVPYFACRGYASQSEVWQAGQRMARHVRNGQDPVLFYLGDHDPSGLDMTRDVEDRLAMFVGQPVETKRLALNMAQIRRYNPPPNPAKLTDSRSDDYIASHGASSWELDALKPNVIADLIRKAVESVRDETEWLDAVDTEETMREKLVAVSDRWGTISDSL